MDAIFEVLYSYSRILYPHLTSPLLSSDYKYYAEIFIFLYFYIFFMYLVSLQFVFLLFNYLL
jgi:hypothetical protein